MLVSTRGRYALRVMLELAQHGRDCYTALSSIASEQGISGKYLESIIALGSVDGVKKEHICTVDGFSAEIEKEIVEGLENLLQV